MVGAYHWVNDMAKQKVQPEEADSSRAKRLVIQLGPNDAIDWESLRDSQKEQLLSIVNNDVTILEHIGMAHESAEIDAETGEPLAEITLANVATGLDIISQANALLFRMIAPMLLPANPYRSIAAGKKMPMELDKDIVLATFRFTKAQHEEMDPRALRLAKQYLPEAAKKNLDLWILSGMFLKFTADNAQNAIRMQLARDQERLKQGVSAAPSAPLPERDNKVKPVIPPNGHDTSQAQPGSTVQDEDGGGESLEPGAEPIV